MTRFAPVHRGRAILIRRLEALEQWRRELPARTPYRMFNPGLLTSELLEKLVSVGEWMAVQGEDALQDDHRVILSEVGEFYKTLEAEGVDTSDQASRAAA